MVVLLLAAMLVFSFAGCTQYDFSALDDFWQNQQEETKKAQEAADKADISSIFELTFESDAKNVEFEYSEKRAELTSRAASDKELFVKATYKEFELGGGNAKISGSLLFTLTTTLEKDTYTVSSYKANTPGGAMRRKAALNVRLAKTENANLKHQTQSESHLKVTLTAAPLPLPKGICTVIDLYTNAIQPLPGDATNNNNNEE